jgi:hypothetical protein
MARQLVTTAGHGSYTCLPVFSSPTQWGTLHRGCESIASLTGTRRVSIAGALQCWLFFTSSFARRVIGLHPQSHLVDACTYFSRGCGLIY